MSLLIQLPKQPILLLFLTFALHQWSFSQNDQIIDQRILESNDRLPCLVCLTEQGDINTKHIPGKVNKALFVYHHLKTQAERQSPIIQSLKSLNTSVSPFYVVNCVASQLNGQEARRLVNQHRDIGRIFYDWPIKMMDVEESEAIQLRNPTYTWGLEMIGADIVQEMGYKGQGVTVGDQDTGVKWDVSSIKENYRGYSADTIEHDYHWYDGVHEISPLHNDSIIDPSNNPCGLKVPFPCDDHNHGTHTVGTMLGQEGDDVIGVAPEANWIGCRCMERGWGSLQTYLRCFEFFLAPTDVNGELPNPAMAPSVINNSWTCPPVEGCDPSNFEILEVAVENLSSSGVVVVVSAGNDGRNGCSTIGSPAGMFEKSLTIGASAQNDSIAGFSSRGPVMSDGSGRTKPDVVAPGVGVRSQIRDGSFVSWNGTSMAGPHAAGLVAMMISANPELNGEVDAIQNIIKNTAVNKWQDELNCDTVSMQLPNNIYGWGRIDAVAAVEEAKRYISTAHQGVLKGHIRIQNPASNELVINADQPMHLAGIQIIDALGRIVETRRIEGTQMMWKIPVSLKNSSYWVRITSANQQEEVLPLLIQH